MAYSQSKKLTDTEKKLQSLKIQLFGKEKNLVSQPMVTSQKTNIINQSATVSISTHQHQDIAYLKKDLLKILTLAMIALFVQLMLKFIVRI
jgi:hypothetical protein